MDGEILFPVVAAMPPEMVTLATGAGRMRGDYREPPFLVPSPSGEGARRADEGRRPPRSLAPFRRRELPGEARLRVSPLTQNLPFTGGRLRAVPTASLRVSECRDGTLPSAGGTENRPLSCEGRMRGDYRELPFLVPSPSGEGARRADEGRRPPRSLAPFRRRELPGEARLRVSPLTQNLPFTGGRLRAVPTASLRVSECRDGTLPSAGGTENRPSPALSRGCFFTEMPVFSNLGLA